jgi:hypothetical protein
MLKLPVTLTFVITAAAAAASCGDDSPGADAAIADAAPVDAPDDVCLYYCIPEQFYDDGGPIGSGDVTCPECAANDDFIPECPKNCRPVG